jgi:exodeoxyribonuclease V gamma subunit
LPAYSCNWLEAARAVRAVSPEVRPLFTELLSEPEPALLIVDPGDLNYFFSNPARYLLKRRLRIDLEGGHECLPVQEPFALDFTGRDSLREGIFARIKRGQDTEDTLRWARAAGILPHGTYGTAVYAKEQALVETLAPLLLDDANAEPAPPVPVEFAAHGITLRGNLLGVSSLGFAWCGFARPTPRQLFQFWIQHVLLCIAAPAGMTKQSVIRNPDACVTFYELNDAETILENLLRAYSEGLRYPLPFFTKTSHRYATCRRKSPSGGDGVGDPRPALRDAMAIWNGSAFQAGERENAYYQAAYRGVCPLDGEFERWALSLLDPMLDSISR